MLSDKSRSRVKKLTSDNYFIDGKYLYFTVMEANLIGISDLSNDSTRYIYGPSQELGIQDSLYGGICKWKNYLVLIPYNAKKIWIYELDTGIWSDIEIIDSIKTRISEFFTAAELIDDNIYMFGYGCECILKMDMNSRTLCEEINFKSLGIGGMKLWAKSHVRSNGSLYVAINDSNTVLKYNVEEKKVDLIELGDGKRFQGITECDGQFYVVSYLTEEFIRWNEKEKTVEKKILPMNIDIWGATCVGERLFFFHPYYNTLVYNIEHETFDEESYKAALIEKISESEVCFLIPGMIRIVDCVNKKDIVKHTIRTEIYEDLLYDMLKKSCVLRESPIKETRVFGLRDQLETI